MYDKDGKIDKDKYKEGIYASLDKIVSSIKIKLDLLSLAGLIHRDEETYLYWCDISKEVDKAYERTKSIIEIDMEKEDAGNDSLGES